MTYVKLRSWHVVKGAYRSGMLRTRCGRNAIVEGTITTAMFTPDENGPIEIHPTSDTLPLGERSCETCLRLAAHDTDEQNVDNDAVPS